MTSRRMLIAGATGGVGRELVRLALANHWEVVGLCRHQERADALRESQPSKSLRLIVRDAGDPTLATAMAADLGDDYRPDALIHLAAPELDAQPVQRLGWDDYEKQLNGILRPVVLLTQRFLKPMSQMGNGRIVAALSAAVLGAPPRGFAAYTTAKYALTGYMRSLAAEYAGRGLSVNCVSPAAMDTDLLRNLPSLLTEPMRGAIPGGKWIEPASVAQVIYWLASEAPSEMTGCNIPITSGANF